VAGNRKHRIGRARLMGALTLITLLAVLLSTLLPMAFSEFFKPFSDGECEECHTGFEPYVIQVDSPSEVPDGYEFEFGLLVQNPWSHELRDLILILDLSSSPGLSFKDAVSREDISRTESGSASPRSDGSGTILITSPVKELRMSLNWNRPVLFTGDLDLRLYGPDGEWSETSEDEIILGEDEIGSSEPGEFHWVVENTGMARSVSFTLDIEVIFDDDPDTLSSHLSKLPGGESTTINLDLVANNRSQNQISYSFEATANYDHSSDAKNSEDYSSEGSYGIEVGDSLVYSKPVRKTTFSESLWIMGRILGFLAVGLFIASFLTGGTVKNLKVSIDRLLKRRIQWHCVISYMVVVTVIIHLAVLYLGYYSNTYKGLVSGGIPLVLMLVVSATGIWKKTVIEAIGVQYWRRIHFWLSILVIVLLAVHGVAEGTDLAFLRWW
jgi:hypothetical protein